LEVASVPFVVFSFRSAFEMELKFILTEKKLIT
jgi:hypothetical protein